MLINKDDDRERLLVYAYSHGAAYQRGSLPDTFRRREAPKGLLHQSDLPLETDPHLLELQPNGCKGPV